MKVTVDADLTSRQKAVLLEVLFAQANGAVSARKLAKLMDRTISGVYRHINDLIDKGWLRRDLGKRGTLRVCRQVNLRPVISRRGLP